MARFGYKLMLTLILVSMVVVTPALAAAPLPQARQLPAAELASPAAAVQVQPQESNPDQVVEVTILHTNDFHGNLEPAGSNPGLARTAAMIFSNTVEPSYTLVLDAGDIMQGTLLSNLFHGESTIDVFNQMGYDVATFGNHEFDWGQDVLISRTTQANFPFVSANIVVSDTGSCDTAGWTPPPFVDSPWLTITLGTAPNDVVIAIIGVTTQETPYITVDWATEGLCFKDPAESISYYWPEMDAAADAIVVLSHLGLTDGGYGYGFPVYGDRTLAHNLLDADTPVDLIIGGHSHTDMAAAEVIGNGVYTTTVAQAHYAGRKVGKATLTIDKTTGEVDVAWERLVVSTSGPQDPGILAAIDAWASDPWYQGEINRVVGYTAVTITRNYNGDSLMGYFINDAIYNDLNNDAEPLNDADMVFNNPGGLRADFTFPVTATYPQTITHGMMYSVLPFGNATVVGDMTGAQILELINQSATLFKGAIQPAGVRFSFYRYTDALPGPQPWAWGAIDVLVWNRDTSTWDPLDLGHTYRVATNEFLAPAGQDGFVPFKYMTDISYWGDMLNGAERWVSATYTISNPYAGVLDGRITRLGDDTSGPVVPVTILHHNDQHGRLLKSGSYQGWTQFATLVAQERQHNPDATLLLNAGDTIQGDSMSYFFKSAGLGYAADGTPIVTPTMQIQPAIAVMNAMTYTAFVLGNHEFNFGHEIFTSVFGLADFPVLGSANVHDDGRYGFDEVGVKPYITVSVPGPTATISIGILGIANHRVPNYELPSNIVGLSFTNPISEAQALLPGLVATNDAVVALTHIGFTTNPGSVEVDNNVDTYLAAQTSGLAAIVGGHSHTDPSKQTAYSGDYKYLPAVVEGADGAAVLVTQMYRYNTYLGTVVLGFMPDGMGGYELVSQAGRYLAVDIATPEDPTILGIVQPYQNMLNAYNERVAGQTTTPIDALSAFTEETNAANMQADASVWELAQNGVTVDFHLSGAMTNRAIAAGATVTNPYTITVADMFTLMPYENSLVAMQMNGPQLKTVLERAYRNYYYYKYVPGYGGYSYYTTCMLDTDAGNRIVYNDTYPALPDGNNVVALIIGGQPIDFLDATTYYTVSTVNYLAAGSCNFNDDGQTLWPLDQIVADTQYYVRDAVIDYTMDQGIVSPAIEGRLAFAQMTYAYLPLVIK
jgi:2',3'-cyclic-nucleotide 2'-phosphodiesterase (5'-nucleotidase family)